MARGGRSWTEEHERKLAELADQNVPRPVIAKTLDRTIAGIENRLNLIRKRLPPKTWFVSFRPNDADRLPQANGQRRMSETFATEAEAKAFAAERLADSADITAGTLNPVVPKRTLGSAGIKAWLDE
jgi:hypothetical protein